MPVAAAFEAEVLPRDPHPLEVLGRGDHLLDQLPVPRLDPLSLDEGRARLADPLGQAVANLLQLAEVEDPRSDGEGIDPVRNLSTAEGLGEDAGQLRLEAADLAAQLKSRLALVDPAPESGEVISQQSGHQHEV